MKNPTSKLVRIRMDLEEFDFEIRYIKGSTNCVADALSRITIEDLKTLTENTVKILKVQTRAMTRSKNSNDNKQNERNVNDKTMKEHVIENNSAKRVPRIITKLEDQETIIRAIYKRRVIYKKVIGYANAIDLPKIVLSELKEAVCLKQFDFLEIRNNDALIKKYGTTEFKKRMQ